MGLFWVGKYKLISLGAVGTKVAEGAEGAECSEGA